MSIFSTDSLSSFDTVKVKSVLSSILTFWTITSTSISASLIGPSILKAVPGVSPTLWRVNFTWSFWNAIPDTNAFSILSSFNEIKVPFPSLKLDKTLTGTLYLLANSTALVCTTFAPWPASSSISSIVIESNFFALGTTLGSVVKIPSTSVYMSHLIADIWAAIATAVVSDPPLPRVVTSPPSVTPWKPVIIGIVSFSTTSRIFLASTSRIFALEYELVVLIEIWDAENDFAFTPLEWSAIVNRAELTVSPVDTKASNSLLSGSSPNALAKSTSLFVSPPIAETTTTILFDLEAFLIISATESILSTVPTDVPPNFWTTISDIVFSILRGILLNLE